MTAAADERAIAETVMKTLRVAIHPATDAAKSRPTGPVELPVAGPTPSELLMSDSKIARAE